MTKLRSTIDSPPEPAAGNPAPGRRRRVLRRGVLQLVLGLVLILLGAGALGVTVIAPDTAAKVAGSIKVEVKQGAQKALHPGYIPEITLNGEGGMPELDKCDGGFTEMVSYREDGVLPLYAAHNNCGGDIILGWDLGQQVRIKGSTVIYEVVEERHTPRWSDAERLKGMKGEFMLQTCYYGQNRMRFLSLAPLDPQPTPR